MPNVTELCTDLAAEHAALDTVVADLTDLEWHTPTPATGWDVADCVSHLVFFDESATLAIADPDGFETHKTELVAAMATGYDVDVRLARESDPTELLTRWRRSRHAFIDAAETAAAGDPGRRVVWYGPSMSVGSFTTARIMETWAHGQDVRDGLGRPPEIGPRLRHILHLGVGARAYSFAAHGLTDPGEPVTVEAEAPDGSTWAWGPQPAGPNRISGPAIDLALVFTQRRHVGRTAVRVEGETARKWISIAQAFAGPATTTETDR